MAKTGSCDAVVTIQDLGRVRLPYLVLQDLSYDVLLEQSGPEGVPHFPTLDVSALKRMRDRQLQVYERAAALLPMSHWLADRLVASGADRAKIVPVHPGLNVPVGPAEPVPERRRQAVRRLLFVGRDPHTKALDVVLAAFSRLRAHFGSGIALTVAGPLVWPGEGPPPEGVDFLGPVRHDRVADLMNSHDLFVMPSRLEGFGIAFAEALARGLPCIGRRAFAMPEIIRPGTGGELVDSDDPDQLAGVVVSALADDDLYRRCAADTDRIRAHFSWRRAAVDIRSAVDAVV
ncbi:glycosyltransferase family 4 protein [Kineosporia mesophila]|nr:glycosyltransferase family 4 protein [Kineosporia mesophila]MCD5350993.1 glycosyltransferase family 4 protein [Kineosporia mesophila]